MKIKCFEEIMKIKREEIAIQNQDTPWGEIAFYEVKTPGVVRINQETGEEETVVGCIDKKYDTYEGAFKTACDLLAKCGYFAVLIHTISRRESDGKLMISHIEHVIRE